MYFNLDNLHDNLLHSVHNIYFIIGILTIEYHILTPPQRLNKASSCETSFLTTEFMKRNSYLNLNMMAIEVQCRKENPITKNQRTSLLKVLHFTRTGTCFEVLFSCISHPFVLRSFYHCVVESVLCSCITV
ncbi:hypothetical protein ILYODFUR_035576 [Ilyodon furcidens]|uniref:Uncharacterized protein n=1 Tax=Ilyodon furcidens TaxID=33524 RepID=A0ABV0UNA9_9TELE